ncbi:MAG: NAD(P)H-hydrate dehydratase [Ruminococcaceae bacterium]|nr:NAD(P)H-hydrate dehydratase [Oscillospiraceae bacterium]
MIRCGTDIVEIDRIKAAVTGVTGFFDKVFADCEIEYFRQNGKRYEILAGFYAAKEAFSKYLQTGIRGFSLRDVSVDHEPSGAPFIRFFGEKQEVSLSISHNKTTAIATVCGKSFVGVDKDTAKKMSGLLPVRKSGGNKGDFGRITVVAGSKGMTGAAVLSAYSALRTGSGLVTLLTAESERAIAAAYRAEIMTGGLSCENGIITADAAERVIEFANKSDAVVFGPGLGQSDGVFEVLSRLIREYDGNLVIDADGLNALSKNPEILKDKSCKIILTPHPGEMSRLAKKTIEGIQNDRKNCAEQFAAEYDVTIVLKGEGTVVTAPGEESYINETGNVGMATAGSGDVLSGMIASLAGQGLGAFDAAALGVYLHGLAGDIAADEKTVYGVVAGDIAEKVPDAFKLILFE